MNNEHDKQFEKRVRFVAKHYRKEGLDADKAWEKFASSRGIVRRGFFRRHLLGAAAVLLVLVGLGTLYVMDRNSPDWVTITASAGQVKDIYLPDSTLVSLAGSSWIRYDRKEYGKERRVVEMNGKAFFEVRRIETRPFSVNARLAMVTVLGTSFQIDESATKAVVEVVTGKVRFAATSNPEQNVTLTAGMSAQYSTEKDEITVLTEKDINTLSWKTRMLRFDDTPLDKVIEDLAAYYQVEITNRSKGGGGKLTATFHKLPLEEVLRVVNQTLDVRLSAKAANQSH